MRKNSAQVSLSYKRCRYLQPPRSQSGVAIITVLLIFSVVMVLTTAILSRQEVEIQRTGVILGIEQAHQYALGAESGAIAILSVDDKITPDKDYAGDQGQSMQDMWAYTIPLAVGPAMMEIQIYDLNSRFNLNWLAKDHPSRDRALVWFRELINKVTSQLNTGNQALQNQYGFVEPQWITRYIDPDNTYDTTYMSKEVPYSTKRAPFTDRSELALVETFDVNPQVVAMLKPYITAIDDPTFQMNINTIPPFLLDAMQVGASSSLTDDIVNLRSVPSATLPTQPGLDNLDDLWNDQRFDPLTKPPQDQNSGAGSNERSVDEGLDPPKEDLGTDGQEAQGEPVWSKSDFTVQSNYFEMHAKVTLGDRVETVTSIIRRDAEGGYSVISRKFGERFANLTALELARRNQSMLGQDAAEQK